MSGKKKLRREVAALHKRVDKIACKIVGHRTTWHSLRHHETVYRWGYCKRCGGDHRGKTPPIGWYFESIMRREAEMMKALTHVTITGLSDKELT